MESRRAENIPMNEIKNTNHGEHRVTHGETRRKARRYLVAHSHHSFEFNYLKTKKKESISLISHSSVKLQAVRRTAILPSVPSVVNFRIGIK
jgi:hypothetical protein